MWEMYKLYSDGRDSMLYFQEWESTSRFMSVCLFYLSILCLFIISRLFYQNIHDVIIIHCILCLLQFFLMWLNSNIQSRFPFIEILKFKNSFTSTSCYRYINLNLFDIIVTSQNKMADFICGCIICA